jgi:hypothetical protein
MRSALLFACLAILLSSTGCATFRGAGGASAEWRQVTTPHFQLRTDFDDKTAVEAAQKLEATRDALVSAAWPSFEFPEGVRTEVYVLSNGLDFESLFSRKVSGVFTSGGRPTFVLSGPPDSWDKRQTLAAESTSIVRHEMAHQLAAAVFAHEPLWFAEGLAQFLETIHESDDHRSVIVGSVNIDALRNYGDFRTTTVRQALSWTASVNSQSDAENRGLYGLSWLLVHWLYNTRPEPFSRFQIELAHGTDPARAFEKAFPGFDPEAADRELQNYSKRGDYHEDAMPLQVHAFSAEPEKLSPALARVARARVLLESAAFATPSDRPARLVAANAEFAKALELDPTNVEAIEMNYGAPPAARVDAARRATIAHPDDARAFRLLGSLLAKTHGDPAERESALRQAVKLNGTDPRSLNELAWLLVEERKPSEALPLALRAVKRAPFDTAIIDTYAFALFGVGRCKSAVEHEERALELQRDAKPSERISELNRHLADFKSACSQTASQR